MFELIKTGFWFLQRPTFWPHAAHLFVRRLTRKHNLTESQTISEQWAAQRSVPLETALTLLDLRADEPVPKLPSALLHEAENRAQSAKVKMGGAGDIHLLYAAVMLSGAQRIVETGVAYGWSTLAMLAAIERQGEGRLVSVDMPYPKMNNESWVGVVVPERLRCRWTLIREPDRFGLKRAIKMLGGTVDLCHYDSDKSYVGRAYGYPLLWSALRSGGVFVSDDIQDNLAFKDFMENINVPFAVTAFDGKYIGIARKI
jgi:predicted O-methyltransferase YrrM